MKRTLHFYGDPVLRTPARTVPAVTHDVRRLADDMVETMRAEQGIGLAAPQIGESVALCILELPLEYDTDETGHRINPDVQFPLVLINPAILESSKKYDSHEEGCLSFPGIRGSIDRPLTIKVRYMDLTGATREQTFDDFLARAIQHEIDHLNGVLFIDRMSAAKRFALSSRLKKMKRDTEERLGLS